MAKPKKLDLDTTALVTQAVALPKTTTIAWLKSLGMAHSGTKEDQEGRLIAALLENELTPEEIADHLDEHTPWGKQHIFLYDSRATKPGPYRDSAQFKAMLKKATAHNTLNVVEQVAMPDELTIITIRHDTKALRVVAVERRTGLYREADKDEEKMLDGAEYVFHAYKQETMRGYIILEWDFLLNNAMIQVSQLPAHESYTDAKDRLLKLVAPWLSMAGFPSLDLKHALTVLHTEEESTPGHLRSHSIEYQTPGSRRVTAKHSSATKSLVGDPTTDLAMGQVRAKGTARQANLWWLKAPGATDAVHSLVHADYGRVNFPQAYTEATVRYVLQELRAASRR